MNEKKLFRERFISERNALSGDEVLALSKKACEYFLNSVFFIDSQHIGIYSNIGNETMTKWIFEVAQKSCKKIYYPFLGPKFELGFGHVSDRKDMVAGKMGILEPSEKKFDYFKDIQVFLIPGIAFDKRGTRLGYGAGFYDRKLIEKKDGQTLIGFAFDFQITEELPVEPHDIKMDKVITDKKIYL